MITKTITFNINKKGGLNRFNSFRKNSYNKLPWNNYYTKLGKGKKTNKEIKKMKYKYIVYKSHFNSTVGTYREYDGTYYSNKKY